MKTFKFYKEVNGNWYVDLPEWKGAKSDLLMIGGADTMLDIISQGESIILVTLSLEEVKDADTLEYKESAEKEYGEGAFYVLKTYKGIEYNLSVFLCDVTKWVFGEFPQTIWLA